MINSRKEACSILGLEEIASQSEIKTAYKKLAKKFHPDSGKSENVSKYYQITEAYGYLCDIAGKQTSAKVVGNSNNWYSTRKSEQESYEKQYKRMKEQKAKAFEKRVEEYNNKLKQQEEEYENAMKAIDAILMAEAIKAMIRENR